MITYDNGFFAVSPSGLEHITAQELVALGAKDVVPGSAGVQFKGDQALLYRANITLRSASKVLIPIREFACLNEVMFYDQIRRMRWESLLTPESTFAFDCVLVNSNMHHSHFIELKAKDAVCDRLRGLWDGVRPSIDKRNPSVRIHLYINNNRCILSLDSTGISLHRRGYRPADVIAPLKENLAAGLLIDAGYTGQGPLYDPMCGSGTFLIEAALIARNIAPGLLRKDPFGFQQWVDYNEALFNEELDRAESLVLETVPAPIVGTEIDPLAYALCQESIEDAGLSDTIRIMRKDCFRIASTADLFGTATLEGGIIVTNPPYGERLEEENPEGVIALHTELGDLFKKVFSGWAAHILTGSVPGAKSVGLKTAKKTAVRNGGLPAKFLRYELYAGTRRGHTNMAHGTSPTN